MIWLFCAETISYTQRNHNNLGHRPVHAAALQKRKVIETLGSPRHGSVGSCINLGVKNMPLIYTERERGREGEQPSAMVELDPAITTTDLLICLLHLSRMDLDPGIINILVSGPTVRGNRGRGGDFSAPIRSTNRDLKGPSLIPTRGTNRD
jgi:hypothetical protein